MSQTKVNIQWNEDTVDHFKLMSVSSTSSEVLKEVIDFVEGNCTPEEGETENDLILDLMCRIYEVDLDS